MYSQSIGVGRQQGLVREHVQPPDQSLRMARFSGALKANEGIWQRHWSPDGRHVAYIIRTSGVASNAIGTCDTRTDSRFRVDIPSWPVDDLVWLPTGERLAYICKDRVGVEPAHEMYTLGVYGVIGY